MIERITLLSLSLSLLGCGGCVHLSPYEVKRWCFDWNSERQCNIQCEVFDHLPPKAVRTRLMLWGYNVGPGMAMPVSSGLGRWTGATYSAPIMETPAVPPESAPRLYLPGSPEEKNGESIPPIPAPPPAAPPAEKEAPSGEQGPQAKPDVTAASYQTPAGARRSSNPGWLFK